MPCIRLPITDSVITVCEGDYHIGHVIHISITVILDFLATKYPFLSNDVRMECMHDALAVLKLKPKYVT